MIYLSLHCHHQKDSCIKMGSDESHFNVSLIAMDKPQDSVHKQLLKCQTLKGERKRRTAAEQIHWRAIYMSSSPHKSQSSGAV